MNALDIIVIGIVIVLVASGTIKGIIKSASSLVSIVAGLFLAKRYFPSASSILEGLGIPDGSGFIGYVLVFGIFYLGLMIGFRILSRISRASALSSLDRLLGGVFGFIKGSIIAIVIMTVLQLALPDDSSIITGSSMVAYSNKTLLYCEGFVPEKVATHIEKHG